MSPKMETCLLRSWASVSLPPATLIVLRIRSQSLWRLLRWWVEQKTKTKLISIYQWGVRFSKSSQRGSTTWFAGNLSSPSDRVLIITALMQDCMPSSSNSSPSANQIRLIKFPLLVSSTRPRWFNDTIPSMNPSQSLEKHRDPPIELIWAHDASISSSCIFEPRQTGIPRREIWFFKWLPVQKGDTTRRKRRSWRYRFFMGSLNKLRFWSEKRGEREEGLERWNLMALDGASDLLKVSPALATQIFFIDDMHRSW